MITKKFFVKNYFFQIFRKFIKLLKKVKNSKKVEKNFFNLVKLFETFEKVKNHKISGFEPNWVKAQKVPIFTPLGGGVVAF